MDNFKSKGNIFFKEEKFEEALEQYNLALESVEDNHMADKNKSILHSNISATYCKLDKYDEALNNAVLSTKLRPDWFKAWYRLSFVLFKLEKEEESKKAIDKTYK